LLPKRLTYEKKTRVKHEWQLIKKKSKVEVETKVNEEVVAANPIKGIQTNGLP